MSVGKNTVELWKRSAAWRFTVIGAVVATVFAVFSSDTTPPGQQSPSPTPGPISNQNAQPARQASTAQQCGPQGQVAIQAPIVVSATGQVPTNVQTQAAAPGGLPTVVMSRFRQFTTQVDAANLEQRLGERCVKMHGALAGLETEDFAYADCFQDGEKKLVAAQACASDLASSDTRFERLLNAHSARDSDASAARIEELARARNRMTPFDETREKWGLNDAAAKAGDDAVAAIAASDRRLDALLAAGGQAGDTPEALQRLAGAAELTSLDRTRLSPQGQEVLARIEAAKARLSESDRRLAALAEAMRGDLANDEQGRGRLIASLSALTDLDLGRATADQQGLVDRARATAAEFAVSDLVAATATVDLDAASPAELKRINDLLISARRYGGQVTPETPQAKAVAAAERAEALLTQSDRRIAAVHEVAGRIAAGGPAEFGQRVLDVFGAVTAFDIGRMSEEDRTALARLDNARQITLATQDGVLTRDVPVFVGTDATDELTQHALSELRRHLSEDGFQLVEASEQAALSMKLKRTDITQKSVRLSGSTLKTAEVALVVSARWTVSGEPIAVPTAKGDAAGSDPSSLAREAVEEAAAAAALEIARLAGS